MPRKVNREEKKLAEIYSRLGHPLRQQIIKFLAERGKIGFTELKTKFSSESVGTIYHHLDSLGGLISQDAQKKYFLTPSGWVAHELITTDENKLASQAGLQITSYPRLSTVTKTILFEKVFKTVNTQAKAYLLHSIIIILLWGWVTSQTAQLEIILSFFGDSMIRPPSIIYLEAIISWIGIFFLVSFYAWLLYRSPFWNTRLFVAIPITLSPLLLYPALLTLQNILSINLLNHFFEDFPLIILVGLQFWVVGLLSTAIKINLALKQDKAVLISLLTLYTCLAIAMVFIL
ncbi:MAG: winged helix-turn-helix domain-containing protein [Candidatus Heimdallarchaeota archaeon]